MTRKLTMILTAGLSALLGSLTLSAQGQQEVATVPFAFHANTRTLPAGKYTVSQHGTAGLFQVSDSAGHSIFVAAPELKEGKADNPRLTFACYGHDCSLSQVWMPGSDIGYVVSKRSEERSLGMSADIVSVRLTAR